MQPDLAAQMRAQARAISDARIPIYPIPIPDSKTRETIVATIQTSVVQIISTTVRDHGEPLWFIRMTDIQTGAPLEVAAKSPYHPTFKSLPILIGKRVRDAPTFPEQSLGINTVQAEDVFTQRNKLFSTFEKLQKRGEQTHEDKRLRLYTQTGAEETGDEIVRIFRPIRHISDID